MTIADVARRVGVSRQTVSNALNGRRGSMTDETFQRVTQAMRDYEDCLRTRQWWNFELQGNMCVGVWGIRVEGYWFQYIKCSAFPF